MYQQLNRDDAISPSQNVQWEVTAQIGHLIRGGKRSGIKKVHFSFKNELMRGKFYPNASTLCQLFLRFSISKEHKGQEPLLLLWPVALGRLQWP